MAADLARLQKQVAEEIPLAHAAQIHLDLDENDRVYATAPFAPNRNMHHSAFGGSLYVVAIVCGFAQTQWLLERAGIAAEVVVHTAAATYRLPLRTDLRADIEALSERTRTRFVDTVRRRGRARLDLTIVIGDHGARAFELQARFVARVPSADNSGNAGAESLSLV